MLQPDQNVTKSILRLSSHPDTRVFWADIEDWFTKSYADKATKHVFDMASDDSKYRIQQGRCQELQEICRLFKKIKEGPNADRKIDERSQSSGLETL